MLLTLRHFSFEFEHHLSDLEDQGFLCSWLVLPTFASWEILLSVQGCLAWLCQARSSTVQTVCCSLHLKSQAQMKFSGQLLVVNTKKTCFLTVACTLAFCRWSCLSNFAVCPQVQKARLPVLLFSNCLRWPGFSAFASILLLFPFSVFWNYGGPVLAVSAPFGARRVSVAACALFVWTLLFVW